MAVHTSSVFPPPQRLPVDRQQRMRSVLLDTIGAAPAADRTRSRARGAARHWRVTAAGVAAAAAGALAWVLLGPGSSAPAAAWAPVPTAVPAPAAARLVAGCEDRIAQHRWPINRGQVSAALAEQRGASTAVLLVADGGHDAICIDPHGSGTGSAGGIAGPLVGISIEGPASGALTVDETPGGPGLGLWAVYGRISSPRAVKVLVTLTDGRQVTATLAHGHYMAWWPATTGADGIRAVDSAGHTVAVARLDIANTTPAPRPSR